MAGGEPFRLSWILRGFDPKQGEKLDVAWRPPTKCNRCRKWTDHTTKQCNKKRRRRA